MGMSTGPYCDQIWVYMTDAVVDGKIPPTSCYFDEPSVMALNP